MAPKTNMVSGWDVKRLGELADIVGGGTPVRNVPGYWNGDIPWVTPTEITELRSKYIRNSRELITESGLKHSSARLLPVGTVLMTSRASIGYAAINMVEIATNQGFQSLICRPGFINIFAFHVIQSIRSSLEREATGTTFLEISSSKVKQFELLVPSENEQREIAHILDAADEAIAKAEALIAKLKAIKQGLLHDLLTRGLDDNGQLRDPERHPEQFKNSHLGRVPIGWTIGPLGQQITLQRGFDITQAQQDSGQIPIVSSSGITSYHSKSMVEGPGVVIGRKGKLGDAFYIEGPFWPHDTSLWVKDFHGNQPRFVAMSLRSLRLERFDAATSVPTLNRNTVHALLIALPCVDEQGQIIKYIAKIDMRIDAEEYYLAKIKLTKKGLLQDLLTGRVRVPEATIKKTGASE